MLKRTNIVIVMLLGMWSSALAATPASITIQGQLTDSSGVPLAAGQYTVVFRIFDSQGGSSQVWPVGPGESQTIVVLDGGLWTGALGAVSPLSDAVFAEPIRWLEVEIDGTILPRIPLVTAPYAFRVATVDGASGGTITSKLSVGPGHTNTGGHAFTAGANNNVSGMWATAPGGSGNDATGEGAVVGGGTDNTASATRATVAGGSLNEASADQSFIGGGQVNFASGYGAVVAGGIGNVASGIGASSGGGSSNFSAGNYSTVAGGFDNGAADSAAIGGGARNLANGIGSTIGGGGGPLLSDSNIAIGTWATIGGGRGHIVNGDGSTIAGGEYNQATDEEVFVGGGADNIADAPNAAIAGGSRNVATGTLSYVGGGGYNKARGSRSVVSGGGGTQPLDSNAASGTVAVISGGARNAASGNFSVIGGGFNNSANGSQFATIGGGSSNVSGGQYSTVGGGGDNRAVGSLSTVGGGASNRAYGEGAVVSGGGGWAFADSNVAGGNFAMVLGGVRNYAMGNGSLAAGYNARALHHGSFVWADSSDGASFASTDDDQFLIRADGGVGIGTNQPYAGLTIATDLGFENGTTPIIFMNETASANARMILSHSPIFSGWGLQYQDTDDEFLFKKTDLFGQITTEVFSVNLGTERVGIGVQNPTHILQVEQSSPTDPIADAWTVYSSRRWKTDVHPLPHPLETIARLRGVGYRWKTTGQSDIGLIAEEVGEVIPQIVQYEANGVDAQSVDYARLVALLIEGIKEQQARIDALEAKLNQLAP
ncbi:MAG TPA: tail fiber domain-containing protein [bacterium]|nr:tail fiber domain-containing protein [bacterium]